MTDDYLLVNVPHARRNWQLALYASFLASGHTLYSKQIKAATIESYLRDVARFLGRFCDVDPRFPSALDSRLAPPIRAVLDELKRWEKVPNKLEPFTLAMLAYLETLAAKLSPDGLIATCVDFFLFGLYAACRLSEYAQRDANRRLGSQALDVAGVPLAFQPIDFEFRDASNCRMPLDLALRLGSTAAARVFVTWSHQKNGNHGERRLFIRNDTNPSRCMVRCIIRILLRHRRLVSGDPSIPVAVYRTDSGAVEFLSESGITSTMRRAASHVYKIDFTAPAVSDRWSSHSLRVGACVMLHSLNFSASQIKFLCRWKSDAFMAYLRNVAVLSQQQNQAVNLLDHMPNIL